MSHAAGGAVSFAEDATLEFNLHSSHLRDYKTTAEMRTVSGSDGFGEDADNDGIANGLEFVLHGSDLLTPRSAVLPAINAAAPGETRFTFLRAARARGHASIVVKLSDDLTNWPENRQLAVGETTATSDPRVEVIPHDDHDETTVVLPQGAPRTFVRIRVIERISGIEE